MAFSPVWGSPPPRAQDLDHFITTAIRMGKDMVFRSEVSQTIAAEKHRLYNDQEPVQGLEKALKMMMAPKSPVVTT